MENSKPEDGMQRRKLLGWMGFGIAGAFAMQSFPLRFLSGRISRKNSRNKKITVSLNEQAVKRSKRVK